jgi:hypothetical protein
MGDSGLSTLTPVAPQSSKDNDTAVRSVCRALRLWRCSTRGPCAAVSRGRQAAQRESTGSRLRFASTCRRLPYALRASFAVRAAPAAQWVTFLLATREKGDSAAAGRRTHLLWSRDDRDDRARASRTGCAPTHLGSVLGAASVSAAGLSRWRRAGSPSSWRPPGTGRPEPFAACSVTIGATNSAAGLTWPLKNAPWPL